MVERDQSASESDVLSLSKTAYRHGDTAETQAGARASTRQTIPCEAYSGVLDTVLEGIMEEHDLLESQRSLAPQLVGELRQVDPPRRHLLVKNSAKLHTWAVAEELLAKCASTWTEDPREAEDLAGLALEITDNIQSSGFRLRLLFDLRAQAWSYVGNCRRIQTDFHAASKCFATGGEQLARGTGDPVEQARFLDLKSSLLADLRDYEQASALLGAAIEAYRGASARHLEGRALIKLAKFVRDSGEFGKAIPILESAVRLLDPKTEPWLAFAVKKNILSSLIDLGRMDEAQAALAEVRELARVHGSRLERLRLLWVEARLRGHLGQTELAEEAFNQARQGFISAGIGNDVALVSLDLAALYLRVGRTDEVRQLAVEMMPLFASRNVRRELMMAWRIFSEAAERDTATLALVAEVADRIRSSQGNGSSTVGS